MRGIGQMGRGGVCARLLLLAGVAALVGACDKKHEEEAGTKGFPLLVKAEMDSGNITVHLGAGNVATITSNGSGGGQSATNAFGNGSVTYGSDTTELLISIPINGEFKKKLIKKSQFS